MVDILILDYIAIAWFFLCWAGYNRYSEGIRFGRVNLVSEMAARREEWMQKMLLRDSRIVDFQILQSLGNSTSFFASTSILILAGLIAVLAANEQAIEIIDALPFAASVNQEIWICKVLLLIFIFIYAFFKFGWAMRQFIYCAIMVGSVGSNAEFTKEDSAKAKNAARVASLASTHTNRGIHAYYFGLALLAWHIHPLGLILSSLVVVAVLYRREHHSRLLSLIIALLSVFTIV